MVSVVPLLKMSQHAFPKDHVPEIGALLSVAPLLEVF